MLKKLGEALKRTQNKIANALFLDKNLVDSIVRELQRALIEADVEIMLVKQLTDKIKKIAFDERIKEIEKKEHLIKVLHDELITILGESKKLELKEKKQTKIMLLGLYGAGKCIHEKTKIQLSSGEIIKAKELYKRYNNKQKKEQLKDGEIINIKGENLFVPSYNPITQEIENKQATHIWKLKKQELIEVRLDNGNDYSIKVTPEHPFFTLRDGQVIKTKADELREQDLISIPNKILSQEKLIDLFDEIKKFDFDTYLSHEEIEKYLPKEKTLKEICKNLTHKRNYAYLTQSLKKGKIPLELIKSNEYNFLKLKGQKEKKIITFPIFLTADLSEFIGYVVGDGYINKSYIEIISEDKEIIKRLTELSKSLFNISPRIKKDERYENLYGIQLCSKTLVKLFEMFKLTPGKKGKKLQVPTQIMLSSNETIRQFLKAYFDCDSHPSKNKRFIELTSESQILIQQINFLLRRFGILSSVSKKTINKISYWRLYIKARYAEIYSEKIGYIIKNKQEKVKEYRQIGVLQGSGNQDMIPLGKVLKALRLQLGFSIGEIQENAINSYGIHEQKGIISKEKLQKLLLYYKLKKRGIFWDFLEDLSNKTNLRVKYHHNLINGICKHLKNEELIFKKSNQILISEKGQKCLQIIKQNQKQVNLMINNLELIANSNICWIPVKEIKEIKNDQEYVYDLTVKDNHSFIAEGFIVHNTTTIAKLGNYFQKRGKKVALVGLDVHRPAAKEQLMQLAEKNNLKAFVDLEETNALKTFKKFEKDLKKFDLVLVDTAGRHSLDKELIKEIKELGKEISPDETILVMPADVGQAAKKQAKEFQDALKISGVIITRMDSSAKAGGALTACAEVKAGVYFITTGEKINDLEDFEPKRFLSRLLGMGDLETLIEKIKSVTDEKKQEKMQKKLEDGKLSLEDVVEQVKSMNSMGGFDKLKGLIPGMSSAQIPEDKLGAQEEKVKKWEHIIKSMTPEEKENPEILQKQTSRISRVAKGAGVNTSDVRSLLKQYDMLQSFVKDSADTDMSKGMSQKQMQKMMKKFGKKKTMRFK